MTESIKDVMNGQVLKDRELVLEYVQPHIQMLIFEYPSHMLSELIRKYIYKVLNDVDVALQKFLRVGIIWKIHDDQ